MIKEVLWFFIYIDLLFISEGIMEKYTPECIFTIKFLFLFYIIFH